jgi:hypothetical protein
MSQFQQNRRIGYNCFLTTIAKLTPRENKKVGGVEILRQVNKIKAGGTGILKRVEVREIQEQGTRE